MPLLLILLTSVIYHLISPSTAFAVEPKFEPGGALCSRNEDYPDRPNPACYVVKNGTSNYNLYIPQSPRGSDPNVSETCFEVNRSTTVTQATAGGYQVVSEPGLIFIHTTSTEWPWSIPSQADAASFQEKS